MFEWLLSKLGIRRTQEKKIDDERKERRTSEVKERSRAAIDRAELLRRQVEAETLTIQRRKAAR